MGVGVVVVIVVVGVLVGVGGLVGVSMSYNAYTIVIHRYSPQ